MKDLSLWLNEKLLELNGTNSMEVSDGFTRLSFSKEEAEAHNQFIKISNELGLIINEDLAGNKWALWKVNENAPTIALGSHLDTVPSGGGYDGVTGILCGLATIKVLKDRGFKPSKNIAVICFVSEESARFGISTIGSKAVAGLIKQDELLKVKDINGVTVKDAMKDFGIDFNHIEEAEISNDQIERFIEIHIEQGSLLEEKNLDFGIVEGIASPIRLQIYAIGKAGHTGTTPMDKRYDAFNAISPVVQFINKRAKEYGNLLATVSTINIEPNVLNVIPSKVELGVDIRSVDDNAKERFVKLIKGFCKQLEKTSGVKIETDILIDEKSVKLDPQMSLEIYHLAKNMGFKLCKMNSGAGHDVMNMAYKCPSALIFIPCRGGISHHPDEHTSIKNLQNGTNLLVEYIVINS